MSRTIGITFVPYGVHEALVRQLAGTVFHVVRCRPNNGFRTSTHADPRPKGARLRLRVHLMVGKSRAQG